MQVTAFSRWEKVLPKLVEDSRYKAIPTAKERRQVFDDFCRNVAAEQKAVQARKETQRCAGRLLFIVLALLKLVIIIKIAEDAQICTAAVLHIPGITKTGQTPVRHLAASLNNTSCLTVRLSLGTCCVALRCKTSFFQAMLTEQPSFDVLHCCQVLLLQIQYRRAAEVLSSSKALPCWLLST